jgi:hypothetical protein
VCVLICRISVEGEPGLAVRVMTGKSLRFYLVGWLLFVCYLIGAIQMPLFESVYLN